jgi:tRNA-2-methylthio-N6-dimethylallyladenosine synthase
VYIKTYGCQMNERDSDAVASMLRTRGYAIVDAEEDADVILLNTCSVREQAEQKAIGKAGYVTARKKKNKNLLVGIMGCMAQNRGVELIDKLPDLDLLVGTQKFHMVPEYLDNLVGALQAQGPRASTVVDLEEEEGSQNTIRDHSRKGQVSSFVSIMQGCNMSCSFCIVPKTRGIERARPIEHIVEEVEELVASGTREVTLLGQIVTSYGRREIPFVQGKSPFVQLLERLHGIRDLYRIRFTSPHPRGFKSDLVEAFRDLPKLCEYIHLPVQSGSDSILKVMNRPYTRKAYLKLVDDLRAVVPDMNFSTDVIVGFPGETTEDFQLTCDLFDYVRFDMAFIFKYSKRTGTPAEVMDDQIPQEVKEERNKILLEKLESYSLARNQGLIGTTQEVLVEKPARRGEGMLMGRTRGFRKVVFPGSNDLIGNLIQVKIENASVTTCGGEIVEH